MNATDALRFLAHEAEFCRSHDECEALCLLHPALVRVLELPPMNGREAIEFRREFKALLQDPRRVVTATH